MINPEELYTFYFKIVYTERTFYWNFSPDMKINDFINQVTNNMREIEPDCNIEIVEAGQYNNINGHDSEMAPKINYYHEYTLNDLYGRKWRNTSFYIRFIQM